MGACSKPTRAVNTKRCTGALNTRVRLARAIERWQPLVEPYRSAARKALSDVAQHPGLSPDVLEIVTRALAAEA